MAEEESWPGPSNDSRRDYTDTGVVIIGAGVGGMCVAIDLITRNNSRDFVILEKSAGVGGVWYDNTYPGCGADVQSIMYSYSFAQNSEWSRSLPGQKEILAYFTRVAQHYRLYEHIRFGSLVEGSTWDENSKKWHTNVKLAQGSREAETNPGYTISSNFLVSAVGQLNQPRYPDIQGLNGFTGKTMHSSRWDWSYDLTGKTVALVGTGCSAVQILPEVAKFAKKVTVFQREPHWIIPRGDYEIPESTRALYRLFPYLQDYWRRRHICDREATHAALSFGTHEENKTVKKMALDHMHEQLPNQPELWEKLTPKYALGCKRIVMSDSFYPALARPNVHLETRHIHSIKDDVIRVTGKDGQLADAEPHYDLIICATGFRAQEFLHPLKIVGRNGRVLHDQWKDGAQAYLGTCAEDMPNLGIILGPNSGLLHNSFILMIEAQSRYISGLVKPVLEARKQGKTLSLTPRHEKMEQYNKEIQERLQSFAVTDNGCNNWYKTDSGRITNLWPGLVKEYQQLLERVYYQDYEVGGTGKEIVESKPSHKVGRAKEELGTLEQLSLKTLVAFSTTAVVGGIVLRNMGLGSVLKVGW
ncbi:hypothetical protein M426DRAFT_129151 [Hypoxylon sp. CI-4A]|nr:hypothetical protein M426DRAFT_129151 [Hypoxylon sp. CI-4A]